MPIEAFIEDDEEEDEDGEPIEKKITVTEDEGIRKGVTPEKLAKIKPAFKRMVQLPLVMHHKSPMGLPWYC